MSDRVVTQNCKCEVRQFFTLLFGDSPNGFIEIRAIDGTVRTRVHFYSRLDDLIDDLANPTKFPEMNIYFGVGLRARRSGKKEHVGQISCLWVDIDAKDKEITLDYISQFKPPPSIIVDSGHGFHLYWLLDKPYQILDEGDRRIVEGLNKGLAKRLGGDSAFDLGRILRVPHTQNLKDPRNPLPVKIVEIDPNLRYNLKEFQEFWVDPGPNSRNSTKIKPTDIPNRFWRILQKDKKLKATWEHNRPDLRDQSRSGYDMALADLCIKNNFTQHETATVLMHAPYNRDKKLTKQYLSRTIGKAVKLEESPQKPSALHDVIDVARKWLCFEDYSVIEVCLAAIVANKLPTDPFWLFLISPSGGSKTELFRALKGKYTYELSDLTEHTLISGHITNGKDPSLLPKLSGKVLIMKDFTTVLSMRYEERLKILATMREIHDGYIDKAFGTGKKFTWKGKVGFVAGVTPVIDKQHGVMSLLGPRFVQFRINHHDRNKETRKAMDNMGKETQMRKELNSTVQKFLSQVGDPDKVEVPDEISGRIIYLANYTAVLRSEISRDGRTQEVQFLPESEIPTRLAKCYLAFVKSLACVRRKERVTDAEYEVLKKIAKDSVPARRTIVVEVLYDQEDFLPTQKIGERTKLPTTTTKLILENLFMLEFVEREGRSEFRWRLSQEGKSTMEKSAVQTRDPPLTRVTSVNQDCE